MQLPINSANINTLVVVVKFDIYNRKVIFDTSGTIYNGNGAQNVKGISFSLIDEGGLELANGGFNLTSPQIAGPITSANNIWTLDLSSLNTAFLFQPYKIGAVIIDANGTPYYTVPVVKNLCQPANIDATGFVPGCFQIIPDCINSILTVKDITAFVYNGLQPNTPPVRTGTLYYPTGTINPVNFTGGAFSNNVVYTGEYRVKCTTVAEYNLQDDVYVDVTYLTNNVFPVTCDNSIADILCCLSKIQDTAIKNCDNAIGQNAKQQMADISTSLFIAIGKQSSGQDASAEVAYIKKFLKCDCGSSSLSQSQFTPINPAVTSIVIQGVGGTTVAPPTINGNTQTYNIASNIYQVVKGNPGDLAFSITTNTSIANTVQYVITFNYDLFAGSILTAIGADPALENQLNALINATGFNTQGLNGKCIIDLTKANYSASFNITGATLVDHIVINGVVYLAPINTFANNAAAVQAWLTSLSLGTFTVNVASNIISILSINNTNQIATISFTNPTTTIAFVSSNATLNQILQAIFDYVCGLTAAQVTLATTLNLCTFDYNGNLVQTPYNGTQAQFNAGLASSLCNIVARIQQIAVVTCASIMAIFNDNPNAVFDINNDRLLSWVAGACTRLTARQLALAIINAINSYQDVQSAYCAIQCIKPISCPDITGINMSALSQTQIGIYGVTFSSATTGSQTLTVKHRVTGTSTWTTDTNALVVFPNGNVSVSPPFKISGLVAGTQYDIQIINNCGGTGIIQQITTPAGGLFTGQYMLDNSPYLICGDAPITLYSALPYATGVQLFTNVGLTTPVTGYLFVVKVGDGFIYQLNNSTGVVGVNTGSSCSNGVPGSYILGNAIGGICSIPSQTLYTNGAFTVGGILYQDSALTMPVTGFAYVVRLADNIIYNLNNVTGVIGANTGNSCNTTTVNITSSMAGCQLTNVAGISGFTPSPPFPLGPGGTVTGTHGAFTGTIACTITGTPIINPSNITLYKNGIKLQCINVTAAGTFTFGSQTFASSDVITIALNTGGC